jgi:hypothetical protein
MARSGDGGNEKRHGMPWRFVLGVRDHAWCGGERASREQMDRRRMMRNAD